MLDKSVIREGVLLYKGGTVYHDGWQIASPDEKGGMCREVSALACLYVAKQLQEIGLALIGRPGGLGRSCADMPGETPVEWLCDETRAFLDPSYEPPVQVSEKP